MRTTTPSTSRQQYGQKNFENATALIFTEQIMISGKELIKESIELIIHSGTSGRLKMQDCERALAAIEFVAAALGSPSPDLPVRALEWLSHQQILIFRSWWGKRINMPLLSLQALQMIVQSSELKEWWSNHPYGTSWIQTQEDLRHRIQQHAIAG